MQVEAFMKQLPRILPRSSIPDKTQLSVRSSPPSLAPKDASGVGGASGPGGPAAAAAASGGGVKVIAMATLPQQQGGPVPVMFLPQGCLSYEREKVAPPTQPPHPQQHAPAAPTSVLQKARGNTSKRPLEVVMAGAGGGSLGVPSSSVASATPVKRRRGRPRKHRPEDALPAPTPPPGAALSPQPPPPPTHSHPSIITPVTGGVIQKASSSTSQPVLELVIQEQPGLVLSQLPAVSDTGHQLVEHRRVVVQCQPGGASEPDRHSRPLLLFQSPGNTSWELAAAGRTPMVEVIQKAPRPSNNNSGTALPPAAHLHPPLPLPKLHEERGEVEITLTPVEQPLSPPPSTGSSVREELRSEEEPGESSTSSKREGH